MYEKEIIENNQNEINLSNNEIIVDILSRIMHVFEQSHKFHLQVNSQIVPSGAAHAIHTALGDFYEEVVDLKDSLIESYQGKYGIIMNYTDQESLPFSIDICKEYYLSLATDIEKYCYLFPDSWVKNQLDEIVTLLYKLLYKLNNL